MGRVVYYLACGANVLALGAFLFVLLAVSHQMEEYVIAALAMLVPALSLWALIDRPDFEERKLLKKVRKARLKAELKELGEE